MEKCLKSPKFDEIHESIHPRSSMNCKKDKFKEIHTNKHCNPIVKSILKVATTRDSQYN